MASIYQFDIYDVGRFRYFENFQFRGIKFMTLLDEIIFSYRTESVAAIEKTFQGKEEDVRPISKISIESNMYVIPALGSLIFA